MINPLARQELLKHKGKVAFLLVLAAVNAVTIVWQAWLFAKLIDGLFLQDLGLGDVAFLLVVLSVAIVARLGSRYGQDRMAQALSQRVKESLRGLVLSHMMGRGLLPENAQGESIHILTDGLDQVESYVGQYIPQIFYALITPLVMGLAIIDSSPVIGLILLVTVPLIPFFMILIGKQAEKMNQEQWERMSFLSGHFLDILQGQTTLKLFGRAKEQISVIARLSKEFRDSTLRVLRVAFVSALVLELVTTISTALIAVYLGLSLLDGHVAFFIAFFILLLAPEFYGPFRQLGAAFHTGMSGQAALQKIEAYLQGEETLPKGGCVRLHQPLESIRCVNLDYTYPGMQEASIRNVTVSLQTGQSLMLVGESGAGKSTLAHLVAGLLKAAPNTLFLNGQDICNIDMEWWRLQVQYVSQKPHIFAGTLRENLAFGQPVSDAEIWKALEDAEARDIVESRADGLDSLLGAGGLGLSGGERQRLALARAFLKPGQILILDEVSAHLDVETEARIAKALRRLMKGRISLLIGHRLQTMSLADRLLVLYQHRVVQEGTYEDLIQQDGYFKGLVEAGVGDFHLTSEASLLSADRALLGEASLGEDRAWVTPRENRTETSCLVQETESPLPKFDSWLLLFRMLRPARLALCLALIFSFLTVFMNVGLLSTSAWLLASAALHPGLAYLGLAIVGVRFFGIGRAVSRYFERYFSHQMAFEALLGLRVWFYRTLEPLHLGQGPGLGDLLGRIMGDIETLQFFYLRVLIPPISAILLSGLMVYWLGDFSWMFALLIALAFIGASLLIPLLVYRHNYRPLQNLSQDRGHFKAYLSDVLDGLEDILSFGQERLVAKKILDDCHRLELLRGRVEEGHNRGTLAFLLLVQVTIVVTASLAGQVFTGVWNGVLVAVMAMGVQAWFEALQPMTVAFTHGHESQLAVQRLGVLARQALAVEEPDEGVGELVTGLKAPSINFTRMSFAYADTPVYKDFSLQIRGGEKVALVGASGCGKSTLLAILNRLYDYEGSIRLNEQELRHFTSDQVRQCFSTLQQDTYIFHASLEENIRLACPGVSRQTLDEAIAFAQLEGLVKQLPQGLHTMVGHGGFGLSGGERQRVALARLYLQNRPIVLLDEPLEGLDHLTRSAVYSRLLQLMEGKTSLYITHHLEGLAHMDRIVFLEQGQIIEEGTFEELLAKRGRFWRYCQLSMARV